MTDIILASSSPRRTMLLSQIGIEHRVLVPDVEEDMQNSLSPPDLVQSLSYQKAFNVAQQVNEGLVIGADTIVVCEGVVFGKPCSEEQALSMLQRLQGNIHQVYTAVTVINVANTEVHQGFRQVEVEMKPCSEKLLKEYISTGEPMDKAGAYSIQGQGASLISGIHGDFYAVVGLPLELTVYLLNKFGNSYPFFY